MSGFQFPPPPPPPPSRRPDQHQVGPRGQSETRGRGRGRGRGTNDYSSRARGGYRLGSEQQHGRGHTHYSEAFGAFNKTQIPGCSGSSTGNAGYHAPAAPHLIPPGSYINPAFASLRSSDGNDFAGNDSTRQQVNWQQNGQQRHNLHSQSANARPNNTSADSTVRLPGSTRAASQHSSQKRKLDVYQQSFTGHQTRELAGGLPNPIVPSFGGPIVPGRQFQTPRPGSSDLTRKASHVKNNVLGLTPQDADPIYSSSESGDDDEIADEEAILAKGLGPGLTFHDANGEMRTLNSAADLVAWRNARRRHFPTKVRISQKDAEKRRIGAERRRILAGAKEKLNEAIAGTSSTDNRNPTTHASDNSAHEAKAVLTPPNGEYPFAGMESKAARDQSWQSPSQAHSTNMPTASIQSKLRHEKPGEVRTQGTGRLAIERRDPTPSHDPHVQGETVSLSVETRSSLVMSDADLSDNEAPEELAIKRQPRSDTAFIPCKFFATSGYCRDGSGCRFKHEISNQGGRGSKTATSSTHRRDPYAPLLDIPDHNDKKSLHQRLIEREQQDEDKLALQVIKYLGSVDFFTAGSLTK